MGPLTSREPNEYVSLKKLYGIRRDSQWKFVSYIFVLNDRKNNAKQVMERRS